MTTSPDRNTPCPCGSGRKFKHCCLRKADALPRPAYSEREREELFGRLVRFARREEFAEEVRGAELLFWAGRLDCAAPERRRGLEADENCLIASLHWFIFDLQLNLVGLEEGAGTIADRFLASRGAALTTGERAYLERMRASCLRLYEVVEILPDEGLSRRLDRNDDPGRAQKLPAEVPDDVRGQETGGRGFLTAPRCQRPALRSRSAAHVARDTQRWARAAPTEAEK